MPLFRVVVGHIFHAGLFHVVHHFLDSRLNVAILAARVFRPCPRVHLHDGSMSSGVAPPAQGNEVHGVVTSPLAPGLDVVNLDTVRAVTEGAPPAVPAVYFPPRRVRDTRVHRSFHGFVPSFLPCLRALSPAHMKSRPKPPPGGAMAANAGPPHTTRRGHCRLDSCGTLSRTLNVPWVYGPTGARRQAGQCLAARPGDREPAFGRTPPAAAVYPCPDKSPGQVRTGTPRFPGPGAIAKAGSGPSGTGSRQPRNRHKTACPPGFSSIWC